MVFDNTGKEIGELCVCERECMNASLCVVTVCC